MRWVRGLILAVGVALAPVSGLAQSDDKGFLINFLEENLSGDDRTVTINGFRGALSSTAQMDELLVADSQGVWLTLRGVELNWNRASILRGQVVVNTLVATEIIVARAPVSEASDTPAPEATGFSLPVLPVSIEIGRIASPRIVLDPSLLGEEITAELDGALLLAGGEGRATLDLVRTDNSPETRFDLMASYANASRRLVLDLTAQEEAGGLIGRMIKLPGQPDFELTIKGDGIVDAFAARLRLATGGEDRLAGTATVQRTPDGNIGFDANLGGNVAPLFVPEYAEFFGTDVRLVALGVAEPDGRVDLRQFDLTTRALDLAGSLVVAADGLPERFALNGTLVHQDGSAVLLPIGGDVETRLAAATLSLEFDQAKGPDWTGSAVVSGLQRSDVSADDLRLNAVGRIGRDPTGQVVQGTLAFAGRGVALADPALAAAVGTQVDGTLDALWEETAGVVRINGLTLNGPHYGLSGSGEIDDLAAALRITGQAQADIRDLSRFSAFAGRPLSGSGAARLSGNGSPLAGDFDIEAEVTGQDLSLGQAEADRLLRGPSSVALSAKRDGGGTDIRSLTVAASNLRARAAGTIASAGSDLSAEISLPDLSVLGNAYRGGITGTARLTGTVETGTLTLEAMGRDLAIGQQQADTLLRGQSRVTLDLGLRDGQIDVRNARVENPQLRATATGQLTGTTQTVAVEAALTNLGLLLPEFPGPLSLAGTVVDDARGLTVDLRGRGPGQIDATVKGNLAPGYDRGDLTLTGSAQAALANGFLDPRAISGPLRFDLRLNGPLAPGSVTGRISLEGGRITDPGLAMALEKVAVEANLARGRADISASARVAAGGRLRAAGNIGLTDPFPGDLEVTLERVVVRDPNLYQTTANGKITVKGPLTGGATIAGRIALLETELQVPSTGFGGSGNIPADMAHKSEPAPVRATRARAGLIAAPVSERAGASRPYGLKLVISAPNQVFIRGRGLDAELGGELRLTGTTDAMVPSGGFDLIRGRLDILGKRLELTTASLDLEGDFVPFIDFAASNSSNGITSTVRIEGVATDPQVSFTSSPELPEEEVLAQLLFGRDLGSLSPLQAARLASAVATLAGRGGAGLLSKLRNGIGLDDFDVNTNDAGNTAVTAGKYLSENTYTELSVDDQGNSEIHLNYDVTDNVTLRARASNDGETGIGVFVERDY